MTVKKKKIETTKKTSKKDDIKMPENIEDINFDALKKEGGERQKDELEHFIEETLAAAFADSEVAKRIEEEEMKLKMEKEHKHEDSHKDECCGGSCETEEKDFKKWELNKENVLRIINQVLDPETGIGIRDMGLIYKVSVKDGVVDIIMTLTSMGCPAGPQITTDIDGMVRMHPKVKDVKIEIVWEPAWGPHLVKDEVREMLWG